MVVIPRTSNCESIEQGESELKVMGLLTLLNKGKTLRRVFDLESKYHVPVYVILLVCFLQLAGAAPRQVAAHGQVDDDDCRLKRFSECRCDEFAGILSESEGLEYADAGINVHERVDIARGSKRPSYYCQDCKRCGDGVLVERKCTQKSDTECSEDKCTDDTWMFNFGLKACQPPPSPPPTTPSSTVESKATSVAAGVTGSKVTGETPKVGSSLWLQKNSHVVILALSGGVIVLVVVFIIMVMMLLRMRRQVDSLLASPSSSHNSSRESVGPTHV